MKLLRFNRFAKEGRKERRIHVGYYIFSQNLLATFCKYSNRCSGFNEDLADIYPGSKFATIGLNNFNEGVN